MSEQDADRPLRRTLRRDQRLTRSGLFSETYAQGVRRVGRCMVVWLRRGDGAALRLGVVSSRRVGNAVARNRARRRLREAFRRNRHRLRGEADVVLVARRPVLTEPFAAVERELLRLLGRAGLEVDRPDGAAEETEPKA